MARPRDGQKPGRDPLETIGLNTCRKRWRHPFRRDLRRPKPDGRYLRLCLQHVSGKPAGKTPRSAFMRDFQGKPLQKVDRPRSVLVRIIPGMSGYDISRHLEPENLQGAQLPRLKVTPARHEAAGSTSRYARHRPPASFLPAEHYHAETWTGENVTKTSPSYLTHRAHDSNFSLSKSEPVKFR